MTTTCCCCCCWCTLGEELNVKEGRERDRERLFTPPLPFSANKTIGNP